MRSNCQLDPQQKSWDNSANFNHMKKHMSYQHREPPKYKIVVLGDAKTGKTSLVNRFISDSFNNDYCPTIGIDFQTKTMSLKNRDIKLQVWDTSGQERFRSLTSNYTLNSTIAIIVCDVTQKSSFKSLSNWITIQRKDAPNSSIILVANKIDLTDQRVISAEQINDFACEKNLHVIETSAKTGTNVQDLLRKLTELLPDAPEAQANIGRAVRMQQKLNKLENDNPFNPHVKAILQILREGLIATDAQQYFNLFFQENGNLVDNSSMKSHINQLALTNKSLCNSVLNVVVAVLLTLSVVGLPLAYCFGVLDANAKSHGRSLMFFAFGEKQQSISVTNQLLEAVGVTHRL